MKDNNQPAPSMMHPPPPQVSQQPIVSETKRKQLVHQLFANDFRNSGKAQVVTTPVYPSSMSASHQQQQILMQSMLGGGMVSLSGSSTNVMMGSGTHSTQASIKPKKSQSIEKKATGHLTIQSNAELVKKLPAKKVAGSHKKSKSYLTGNPNSSATNEMLYREQHSNLNLYHQAPQHFHPAQLIGQPGINLSNTLENSFVQSQTAAVNRSYERLLGDTIDQAQPGHQQQHQPQSNNYPQYYNNNASNPLKANQNANNNVVVVGAQSKLAQNLNNMTLQITSKRGSGNMSQSRFNGPTSANNTYEGQPISTTSGGNITRIDKNQIKDTGYNTNKSSQTAMNHIHHQSNKSLSSSKHSRYDQQSRKKSRRSDQFTIGNPAIVNGLQKSKCDSVRTSSKNHHTTTASVLNNNTIAASALTHKQGVATLNIREARTKPTSPDRSLLLIHNSYNSKKSMVGAAGNGTGNSGTNMYLIANQREERKALNMISTFNKNELMSHHGPSSLHHGPSALSSNNQRVTATVEIIKNPTSMSNIGNNSKRKNFKNMFYSPKNQNREAYTEPHSKMISQVQTKEHSPVTSAINRFSNDNQGGQILIQPNASKLRVKPSINTTNPGMKNSSGTGLYNTKDSNSKKMMGQGGGLGENSSAFEVLIGSNSSFQEGDSTYLKNMNHTGGVNNYHTNKPGVDVSFDSSSNHGGFSQAGTPMSYKVKLAPHQQPPSIKSGLKNLNMVSSTTTSGGKISGSITNVASSIDRGSSKPGPSKKLTLQQQLPYTTGQVTKTNSIAASPTNSGLHSSKVAQQSKHYRFQSEAPSPNNNHLHQKVMSNGTSSSAMNQDGGRKGARVLSQNPPNAPQASQADQQSKQQQFLFNQYIKTKKNRPRIESVEGSVERLSNITHNGTSMQPFNSNEPFFDCTSPTNDTKGGSPRSKEVALIKGLIRECFQKYNKPPKSQVGLYKIGKMLGKGAFGKVNLGLHRLTRRLVAVKAINMEFMKDESSKKKMNNEISILKMLRHPNVVKLLETFDTDKHHLIVMELCPGGDLLNYVRKRRKLNEKYAKFVFKQIMEGLAYLHDNGVVHRDIKLDNILLDGHGNIKIADFGVSRKVIDNEILFEQCGTPAYIAPEIVRELGYKGYPVDIWSAGVCLYAMLYGNVPFKANQMGDLNKMILDATIEYKDTVSEEARDLMQRMLQKNPNKRLTALESLNHKWFEDADELGNNVNIFDEQELDLIKKEFTYVSQKAKLKELLGKRQPEDLNTEFTEHSINSSDNTLMKNNSSRSVILCPFNTQAGNQAKSIYEQVESLLIDKDMAIRFNARVRELDRQYEKFNNQDFDNGVYHKYAYNQGKGNQNNQQDENKEDDEGLKEEVISQDDVRNQNLVRAKKLKEQAAALFDEHNYYLKLDEKILEEVQDFGFPREYTLKCLGENVNNHCTTSYYLLCMDQNY